MSEPNSLRLMLHRTAIYDCLLELLNNRLVDRIALQLVSLLVDVHWLTHEVLHATGILSENNGRLIVRRFAFGLGIDPS